MASSGRPSRSDHPTRQQLDELDALMERMLALPVNQPEELLPAAKAPRPKSEPPEPYAGDASSAAVSSPGASTQLVVSEPAPWLQTAPGPAFAPPVEKSLPVDPAPVLSPRQSAPRPAELILPRWLRILVWSNRFFDSSTSLLGPLGRGLRSPPGRTVVGIAGILLLAGAVGWFLLGTWGWTW